MSMRYTTPCAETRGVQRRSAVRAEEDRISGSFMILLVVVVDGYLKSGQKEGLPCKDSDAPSSPDAPCGVVVSGGAVSGGVVAVENRTEHDEKKKKKRKTYLHRHVLLVLI